MRHQNHRQRQLLLQALQVGQDFSLSGTVQCGQWLIEQQQARAAGQCPGDGHPLAFASREFMGPATQQVTNAQQRQRVVPALGALMVRCAAKPVLHVVLHVEVFKQAGFLKHIAQGALVHRLEDALGAVLPDLALHTNAPARLRLQPGQHAQGGGFA